MSQDHQSPLEVAMAQQVNNAVVKAMQSDYFKTKVLAAVAEQDLRFAVARASQSRSQIEVDAILTPPVRFEDGSSLLLTHQYTESVQGFYKVCVTHTVAGDRVTVAYADTSFDLRTVQIVQLPETHVAELNRQLDLLIGSPVAGTLMVRFFGMVMNSSPLSDELYFVPAQPVIEDAVIVSEQPAAAEVALDTCFDDSIPLEFAPAEDQAPQPGETTGPVGDDVYDLPARG